MAAEAPVLITTEIEPSETVYLAVGASLRIHANFVNADSKIVVDPDTLTLAVTPPFTAATTYTYGVGAVIVKNSAGIYQADIALSSPGQWRLQWLATLGSVLVGSNTTVVEAVGSGYW